MSNNKIQVIWKNTHILYGKRRWQYLNKTELKKYLDQYKEIKTEIADLNCRITKIQTGGITQDVVSASSGPPSYAKHSVIISGADIKLDIKLKEKNRVYQSLLIDAHSRLADLIIKIETVIQQIDDSRVRQIIRYKYIDGLNFIKVARKMGGNNTADSVRMVLNRFFENL